MIRLLGLFATRRNFMASALGLCAPEQWQSPEVLGKTVPQYHRMSNQEPVSEVIESCQCGDIPPEDRDQPCSIDSSTNP